LCNTNPTKIEPKLRCSGWVSSSCSTSDTRRVTVKRHEHDFPQKKSLYPYIMALYDIFFYWPLYCTTSFSIGRCIVRHLFLLTVVLYDIFFYWPLYCTTSFSIDGCIVRHLFLLTVVLYDIFFYDVVQYNGQ
jgi:hypothetical protein